MSAPVAMIIGGSRGIGRAAALRLARDGYDVAVSYHRSADEAEIVANGVRQLGRRSLCVQGDVADVGDIDRIVATVADAWGRVDVLVTSAGIAAVRSVEDMQPDEWDRVMAVNLKGTFFCAQRVIPIMKRQGTGRIIMISSQAGVTGGIFIGLHYAASKAGVICLSKSLAKQLAPFGIRVNCIAPGIVETDMIASYPKDKLDALVNAVPLGRIGTPDDVAEQVAFLASPASSYVTGTTMHVNGGIYMP